MRTITVIPKISAVDPLGVRYSPHGSIIPGSTLYNTGRYTWEINDNGSITYGLGRQAVKTVEEAVKVAKSLEKLGYVYKGVRE